MESALKTSGGELSNITSHFSPMVIVMVVMGDMVLVLICWGHSFCHCKTCVLTSPAICCKNMLACETDQSERDVKW